MFQTILGGSSDNNIIDSNNITALGAPAASSNIGIRVSTNANFNNITNNNITALGTTANYGIEVDGAVAVGNKCNNNSILRIERFFLSSFSNSIT